LVRTPNKKPQSTGRQAPNGKTSSNKTTEKDGSSAHLSKIATVMGNQHVREGLKGTKTDRDTMLAHICERLQVLQGAQTKERASMSQEREWFKQVAKGVEGFHLPDPTRWHESARLYQRAGDALCTGQLGRGAQLLEQAAKAEETAFLGVPKFVQNELNVEQKAEAAPEEAFRTNDEASCTSCAKPQDLKIANRILAVIDKMEATPPIPRRKVNWWDQEIEEEEEVEDAE
jgi:hypothetical protein